MIVDETSSLSAKRFASTGEVGSSKSTVKAAGTKRKKWECTTCGCFLSTNTKHPKSACDKAAKKAGKPTISLPSLISAGDIAGAAVIAGENDEIIEAPFEPIDFHEENFTIDCQHKDIHEKNAINEFAGMVDTDRVEDPSRGVSSILPGIFGKFFS